MPISLANGIISGDPGNGMFDDFCKDQNIKPNAGKQEDFVSLPDDIFEALFGGAAYSGKSWILTLLPLFRGFYKFRGFRGILFRRKFTDLEREIIRLSKEYYPHTGATYNEQKHTWEWKEYGSYMDFGHIQHASDVRMYDSSQYNYASFDETTHFPEAPYIYFVGSRVRPSSSFNVAIVRNGTNPGGIGQTWCYNRFVRPNENGNVVIKDGKTGLTRIFIPAFLTDNPKGLEYDPLYAQKLEILPEAEKRAKKYGDWHAFKGSVFTTFRPLKFPNEPDNALHVIEPFAIPEWWPRLLSIDWGKRAMCHSMWAAISPDHRVYVYRERAWTGRDIPYWASEIRSIIDEAHETIIHTVLCGSAWQQRGSETIANQFQQYSGLSPSSSENNAGSRVAGLQLIHDYLRWEKKTFLVAKEEYYDSIKANKIYRIHGPWEQEQYKKKFYDEQGEDNLPVLQIFNTCKTLIETIPMAIYDEVKTEDIAEFEGDDPIDNLRYMCKAVRKFILGEVGDFTHVKKKQAILSDFGADNDVTRMYRRMEMLERNGEESGMATVSIPISRRSRFSRRRIH